VKAIVCFKPNCIQGDGAYRRGEKLVQA